MFIYVDYRLEPDEFVRGGLAAFRRTYWINVALIGFVGLLLAALFAVSHVIPGAKPPSTPTIGAMAAVCLYPVSQLCLRRPRLKWRSRSVNIDRTATFTEAGASWFTRARNAEHRSEMAWASYIRIRETPEFFLLYLNKRTATVIPKRAFSEQDAALFSRFVQGGFPEARLARPEPITPSAQG